MFTLQQCSRFALVADGLAVHVQAEVDQVVVAVRLRGELVLVHAARVLAGAVAGLQLARGVLELLRAHVVELHLRRERQVRHLVPVVRHTPGGHSGGGEGGVFLVAGSRLAEVVTDVEMPAFTRSMEVSWASAAPRE